MYTIISRYNCSFCEKAKQLLDSEGINFVEYNLQDLDHRWLIHLFKEGGIKTVPQVFDSQGKHVGGYTELYQHLKDENGTTTT